MTTASGIPPEALKSRIHADYVWSQIVRGKFQGSLQVGEKEIEVKMQQSNKEEQPNYEYKLRPVLFLVPQFITGRLRSAQEGSRGFSRPLRRLR